MMRLVVTRYEVIDYVISCGSNCKRIGGGSVFPHILHMR